MKTLIRCTVAVGLLAIPALSFAQSGTGLTRAQVYNELVQLEQAGYRPSAGEAAHYPQDLQAAEARVAAQDAARAAAAKTADTGVSASTAQP